MNIFVSFFNNFIESLRQSARSQMIQILSLLLFIVVLGSTSYALIEGWSVLDSVYATVITITTVGYGDLTPVTPAGRIFAIGFTILAISLGGYAISTFAVYTVENYSIKRARKYRRKRMKKIEDFNQHYILCGADLIGTRIAEEFRAHGEDFVIIDDDETLLKRTLLFAHPEYFREKFRTFFEFEDVDLSAYEDLPLDEISERVDIPFILADPTDDVALVKAGIERAQGLVAAAEDERDNLSIVIGARSLAQRAGNDKLRIMAHVTNVGSKRKLYLAGADFVRIPSIISGEEMATHLLYPEIGNWWYHNFDDMENRQAHFHQVDMTASHAWVGKTISAVHQQHQTMVISVKRDDKFISPPPHDLTLTATDIAIVIR